MAILQPDLSYTGSLGNTSSYKPFGSDETILRTKGGPSKRKMKTSPRFAVQRKHGKEFGGRSAVCGSIMQILWHFKPLADYNFYGHLNKLLMPIQALDTENELGTRNIRVTKNQKLLEGFNFNRRNTFDSIIRNPVSYTISKETLTGTVEIPGLIPGINFFVPGKYPLFSILVLLGILPDKIFKDGIYQDEFIFPVLNGAETTWYPTLNGSPAISMNIESKFIAPEANFSLVMGIGIRFGNVEADNKVSQITRAGAAKVMAVV